MKRKEEYDKEKEGQLHTKKMFWFVLFLAALAFNIIPVKIQEIKAIKDIQNQKEIADNIIRFHIIANSDSKEDQSLKLEVKDIVVKELQKELNKTKDLKEARGVIQKNLSMIEQTAKDVIEQKGYHYEVSAMLGQKEFPVKIYGDMVFPAGEYEALQVKIGTAEGKNWWCVMFPTLCFVDGTYSVVPEESKEQLQDTLTEEEYQSLLLENRGKIQVKWKIGSWWNRIINK